MLNLDEVTLVKEVWDMLTEGLQMILQRLTEMKWSDYLDILLVAYLFYRMLPLIHRPQWTRKAFRSSPTWQTEVRRQQ